MSSFAAIPGPTAIYREDQRFSWWTYALMAALSALAAGTGARWLGGRTNLEAFWVAVGPILPALFTLARLRMSTEVRGSHLTVWFGWIHTYRRSLMIEAVIRAEVVAYEPRPLMGLAGLGGGSVLRARGHRGVRLVLAGGESLLIGSQSPEALAASIEASMTLLR